MCGIAGMIGPDRDEVAATVSRMTAAQAHRGPDDAGEQVWPFGRAWAGLGHRRLTILDLTEAGHQPMTSSRGQGAIVFNGEIYNFQDLKKDLEGDGIRFCGNGDSEVLLAALDCWGPEVTLARLEGMFAFAYLGPSATRLVVARDPAGIKPLYLAQSGSRMLFASEVRALLASGQVSQEIDRRGVAGFLAYGAVQQPHTLFSGVESFPPGAWQEFTASDAGGWRAGPIREHWRYPAVRGGMSTADAVDQVRAATKIAVRDHLISDVPVGVFLSSGLDSTILAGLAAQSTPNLRTFTVDFADQPDFSESAAAAESARRFGVQHEAIPLSATEAEGATRDWLGALDQPSFDGLNVYVISQAVRRQGIKVALSGLGGDELFGGYPSFRDVPRLQQLLRWGRGLPSGWRRRLAGTAALTKSRVVRAKLGDMAAGDGSLTSLYLHRRRALSDRQMKALGFNATDPGWTRDFLPFQVDTELAGDDVDPVTAISRLESRFYQGNMLLRDADANGMAHGLEIRVPMLDRRLLDLAHGLPGSVRLPPGAPGKYLLREAFGDLIGQDLLRKPKRGFTLPVLRWMQTSLRPVCETALQTLKSSGVVLAPGVERVWDEFLAAPETPAWTRAFSLVVLGSYLAQMNIGESHVG